MLKKSLQLFAILFVVASCTKEESQYSNEIDPTQKNPLSTSEINSKIDESFSNSGSFNWNQASNHLLWSAIYQGNKMASIGFGTSAEDFDRSKSPENAKMQNEILTVI